AARGGAGGARLSVSCRGAAGGRVGGGRHRGGGGGLLRGGARVGGVGVAGVGAGVAGAWDWWYAPVHAAVATVLGLDWPKVHSALKKGPPRHCGGPSVRGYSAGSHPHGRCWGRCDGGVVCATASPAVGAPRLEPLVSEERYGPPENGGGADCQRGQPGEDGQLHHRGGDQRPDGDSGPGARESVYHGELTPVSGSEPGSVEWHLGDAGLAQPTVPERADGQRAEPDSNAEP